MNVLRVLTMKINLIYLFYELNGAYTSFEDTFYNLRKFTNHDVRFIILYEDKNLLRRFREYLAFGDGICYLPLWVGKYMDTYGNTSIIKHKKMTYNIKGDINIISSEIIKLQKNNRFKQSAKQEILLYPAFIYKKQQKDLTIYNDEINYIKEHKVLTVCNQYNSKFVGDNFIWYMKFSKERIEKLKKLSTTKNDILIAEDYYKNKINGNNIKPFDYKKYLYYRYDKKNNDNLYTDDGARYYENIGKLMFEFILLGKESQYLPKNKKFYDGLSEYMNYLDLDDNNTYIFTNKEKQYFEEKLFMQSNDEFLSLF